MAEGLVGGDGFAADASLIKADANKQRSAEGSEEVDWEEMAATRRSVREYLDTLDEAGLGCCPRGPAEVHLEVGPCRAMDGSAQGACLLRLCRQLFAYAANYLIDLDHAVIVDVEASRAIRQAEVGAARTMIDRVQDQFGLYPERVAADAAYGSAEMLGWLVHERGIEPHIPVFDKSQRSDGTFSRDDFAYDHKHNCYICPAGKQLRQRQKIYRVPRPLVDEDGMMRYRASKLDCQGCSLKPQCCPNAHARKIPRSIHEGARDMAREIAKTEAYVISRQQRKKVEMLFAHLKRILKLDRLRLRGPNGARDEFHLAATAQNLRKLAKLIPMPEPTAA
jgi:Transposase DDE domain